MMTEEFYGIRQRLGLSQRELAERLGVHANSIWRWENGDPMPRTVELAMRYLLATGGQDDH